MKYKRLKILGIFATALFSSFAACGDDSGSSSSSSSSSASSSKPSGESSSSSQDPVSESDATFLIAKGTKPCKEVPGIELSDLAVRYSLPELSKSGSYDAIRFYLHASASNNDATYIHLTKDAFLNRFQDKKSAMYWVVREGGTDGEFEYSTFAVGLKYLVETPRTAEKAIVNTLTAYAKIHTKVGEKEEWDQSKRIMVRRPVYDEGQELCRCKIDLKLDRLTGIRDPDGVLEVEIVDPTAKTYPVKENSQGLNIRGLKFLLPTGKDKFGNEAQHTGTKVFYFDEADLETIDESALKDPVSFVKGTIRPWLEGDHANRKIHWGYSDLFDVSNLPDAKFLEVREWKREKSGANEWDVMTADWLPGRVGKKKDEDDPDVKYDGNALRLSIAILHAKPYIVMFVGVIHENSYFGAPASKVRAQVQDFLQRTMAGVKVVKK